MTFKKLLVLCILLSVILLSENFAFSSENKLFYNVENLNWGMTIDEVSEVLINYGEPKMKNQRAISYDIGEIEKDVIVTIVCIFDENLLKGVNFIKSTNNIELKNKITEKIIYDLEAQNFVKKADSMFICGDKIAKIINADVFFSNSNPDNINQKNNNNKIDSDFEKISTNNKNWNMSTTISRMDDEKITIISNKSLEEITDKTGKNIKPVFVMRCKEGVLDAYVDWDMFISTTRVDVTTRIDKQVPEIDTWNISSDFEATLHRDAIKFLHSMRGAKQLIVEVTPYSQTPKQAIYDISEIEKLSIPLQFSCRKNTRALIKEVDRALKAVGR